MKAYVGVTDIDWYRRLTAERFEHDEVNFWFPSPRQGFAALQPAEPFLFKTHVDRSNPTMSDRVVGVGLFSSFVRMSISDAWDWFGEENGVTSEAELRRSIERYRKQPIGPFDDPEIGAVLLNNVVFFPPHESVAAPDDFARNLVRGKTYQVNELPELHAVRRVMQHYRGSAAEAAVEQLLATETRGDPRLIVPRIGQQAFKAVIAENYHHRCAITGNKVRPVLEAAHVRSVKHGGQHRRDNGLLLRSDVHKLFDRGYIGVDEKYRLRVSPALRAQFGNGDWFYAHAGDEIALPNRRTDRPNSEFLEWHNDVVFRR